MAKIIRTDQRNPSDFDDMEREWCYNGLDCCITAEILDVILPQLDAHTGPTYDFSRALQGPVLEMRCRGILVDRERQAQVIDEFYDKIDRLERQLDRIVLDGVGLIGFNWRSNVDLQTLFYDRLRLAPIMRSGRPTVNRDALEKLEEYLLAKQIVRHILLMRDLAKKISVLKTEIDPDGRIRTSYNIAGTSTGRFSSSFSEFGTGGNLQNVEESLRSIFIADPGMKFAKFDAKSGESHIVGAIEWNLFKTGAYLDAVESGDVHTAVAKICWPKLPWTGDLVRDKDIAEEPYYRHYSYRFMCKKLGHGCITVDHEVLTPDGWKPIADKPNRIMTWTDARSEFQEVSTWTDFIYTGMLQSFEGNSVSLLATHDHRIPYKKDARYGLCETTAEVGPQSKMPLGFGWTGGDQEVPARLIAAFMCDGYRDKYNLTFHFAKERKVGRLIELLKEAEITFNYYDSVNGTYKITIPRFDWPKHPGAFMFDWTEECLADFIDELKWWDGYIGPTSVSISSKHREDLEWYQTFARLLGIGGQIQAPQISGFGTVMYKLQQNQRKWATGGSINWAQIEVFNERVLCPTVPATWFYVRRNGKIFVTGNSNYGGKPHTLAQQSKLPLPVVAEFQPKYFAAFPGHLQWHAWVDAELRRRGVLISLSGRKRQFWGRRNDDATLREAIAYDPQCSLADIVNRAMLRIWRDRTAVLMMQDHDALTFMYPEEAEAEVVPALKAALPETIGLRHGRTMTIPYDCKVGWNRGDWSEANPEGLKDWRGGDSRRRAKRVNWFDRKGK